LKGEWTNLFNECLKQGKIPAAWRLATVKVLYKGKDEASDPHALECTAFKLLSSILMKRFCVMTENRLSDEQFGFRRGRSTLQAASCQKEDIEEVLRHPRGKLHAVFMDYMKAFDLINRTLLIEKLEEKIGRNYTTKLRNILGKNVMQIDDTITRSQPLQQMNGVLQGDPLSSLLFIVTMDITQASQNEGNVKFYAYADMVLVAKLVENLQTAFNNVMEWFAKNELLLNNKNRHEL
jgi:hypothetical protein